MNWYRGNKSYFIWAFVLVAVLFVMSSHLARLEVNQPSVVSYSRALTLLGSASDQGTSAEVVIRQDKWTITMGEKIYETNAPLSEEVLKKLSEDKNIELRFLGSDPPSIWLTLLVSWLPIVFIFIILIYVFRSVMKNTGPSPMTTFSQTKSRVILPSEFGVKFDDVAGCQEAKEELVELVEFLRHPHRFAKLGGKMPKGVLLYGPPGTGKTLLAKAVAHEAQVPFILSSGSEFVEMYVGVGASRVRDLFARAKKMAPCIVFIDELDAIGKHRGGGGHTGGNDEREQTLNQILVELDGFEENSGIIVMAATNRVEVLDKALTRPGRFDRKVSVPLPDSRGREQILKIHTATAPLDRQVDLKTLAATTPGLSGADLANLVNEACILAAMKKSSKITNAHLEEAKDKVLMGKPRKSLQISEDSRRATAIHEAGHAILAYYLEDADPLHKVTIVPHGQALGLTVQMPTDDRFSWNKKENIARIKVLLGGYIAEKMFFGEDGTSTGVSNDLLRAKQLAERMVKDFGMGSIGPMYFGKNTTNSYIERSSETSEAYKLEFDQAVEEIIRRSLKEAEGLLESKREHVALLTTSLVDNNTVTAKELEGIFGVLDIYIQEDEEKA
jgi:cell division protease FtsH